MSDLHPAPQRASNPGDGDPSRDLDINSSPPLLVSIKTAATMLAVGRTTIYELIRVGELDTVHIGRACRIKTAVLEHFVNRLQGPEPARPAADPLH